ncbi:acetate uptake transporter [Pedobacter agri]|uniref:acetate uptake transporter n=1 Tax=Pedobacter agri TaxID=454586 RepID=UPI002931B14C|nr:acetate uptake transporter [Pedobacter agri]
MEELNKPLQINASSKIANPGPLGLCAFGMTTFLLNLHNAGFVEMNATILTMGLFYGGLAQVMAGYIESKKNNTFGLTAFTSFGFFWLSLVTIILFPKSAMNDPTSSLAMGCYLSSWGIFTMLLFVGTLKINRSIQFVFASLTVHFFLLAAGDVFACARITKFAGYEGILCGISAIYTGIAELLNEIFGRDLIPLDKIK